VWHNPFGQMPKIGIVFPIGAGVGLSVAYVLPVPVPTYFEFEAGFVGCASKIYSTTDDTSTAAGALGAQHSNYSSQIIKLGHPSDEYQQHQQSAGLGIPGLDTIYCGKDEYGDEDPYGRDPTVFKIAVVINIVEGGTGVLIVMRNIFPVRLILIFFPFIPRTFKKMLIAFKDILDLCSMERYDISLNSQPFPMMTRGKLHTLNPQILNPIPKPLTLKHKSKCTLKLYALHLKV